MPDYGTELRSRLGMGRYRDRRAGFRDYHLRAEQTGYEREMLSNGYSRRLRGGWQRGYDRGYRGRGGYIGGDRHYWRDRASSAAYEQDYMRPGPGYALRGRTLSFAPYG